MDTNNSSIYSDIKANNTNGSAECKFDKSYVIRGEKTILCTHYRHSVNYMHIFSI